MSQNFLISCCHPPNTDGFYSQRPAGARAAVSMIMLLQPSSSQPLLPLPRPCPHRPRPHRPRAVVVDGSSRWPRATAVRLPPELPRRAVGRAWLGRQHLCRPAPWLVTQRARLGHQRGDLLATHDLVCLPGGDMFVEKDPRREQRCRQLSFAKPGVTFCASRCALPLTETWTNPSELSSARCPEMLPGDMLPPPVHKTALSGS